MTKPIFFSFKYFILSKFNTRVIEKLKFNSQCTRLKLRF